MLTCNSQEGEEVAIAVAENAARSKGSQLSAALGTHHRCVN